MAGPGDEYNVFEAVGLTHVGDDGPGFLGGVMGLSVFSRLQGVDEKTRGNKVRGTM